jgi:hypothetical protein
MKIIRNIFRRKIRGAPTIFGTAIGIFALVVMGSLAEKLHKLVQGALDYYGIRITIQDSKTGMSFFGLIIPKSQRLAVELSSSAAEKSKVKYRLFCNKFS